MSLKNSAISLALKPVMSDQGHVRRVRISGFGASGLGLRAQGRDSCFGLDGQSAQDAGWNGVLCLITPVLFGSTFDGQYPYSLLVVKHVL